GVERAVREHSRLQPVDEAALPRFLDRVEYQPLDFHDDDSFGRLGRRLDEVEEGHGGMQRIYYCATPPATFSVIVRQLGRLGMAAGAPSHERRIMIEKPFGTSLASARELNRLVRRVFGEENVYRIDHYLGKETVQNITAFRFANVM